MTILLTGATGHLGSHITEHAIKEQLSDFNIVYEIQIKCQRIGKIKLMFES